MPLKNIRTSYHQDTKAPRNSKAIGKGISTLDFPVLRIFALATAVTSLVARAEVLNELGVSLAPVPGAAGVVGLAVGFGAQSPVKDYVTGLFVRLENRLRQGDVAELIAKTGVWRK